MSDINEDKDELNEGSAAESPEPVIPPEAEDKAAVSGDSDDLRSIAEEISSLYPPPRLGTELVLLEIDPHRAHAYWNIDVADYQEAKTLLGSAELRLVLRTYDVTGLEFTGANAHHVFDVEVLGLQSHWYLDLWQNGRTYVAEIGFLAPSGDFRPFARSNEVHTPRLGESAVYATDAIHTGKILESGPVLTDLAQPDDEDEGAVLPEWQVLGGAGSPAEPPVVADSPLKLSEPLQPATAPVMPEPATLHREFPRTEWPQRAAVEYPAQPVEAGSAVRADLPFPVAEVQHAGVHPEQTHASSLSAEEMARWPDATQASHDLPDVRQQVEQFYERFTSPDSAISSSGSETGAPAEQSATDQPEAVAAPAPAAAAPAPAAPVAPPQAPSSPLPLENYAHYSSAESGRSEVMLEINTELHIFGRAKPGTDLSLYGQKVELRPDGTFSIRKPLPQGAVVLPLLFLGHGSTEQKGGG